MEESRIQKSRGRESVQERSREGVSENGRKGVRGAAISAKKWNLLVLLGTVGSLFVIAAATVIIDPFLHYHKPLPGLEYPLNEERYQNDGIARHYEYEALLTGTSMSQNFKASYFEELWQMPAIKTAYSGASFHELNQGICRAIEYNPQIQVVVCSLDGNRLIYPADRDEYEDYPEYLYDNNPWNDVSYLLNKEVVPRTLAVVNYTRSGQTTPDMDAYGSWNDYKNFGREAVLSTFQRMEETGERVELSEEDIRMIQENIDENFLKTAQENPQISFYFYLPPYSVCYWDALERTGQLQAQLAAQELAVERLMTAENVRVFGFDLRTDITCNLDNYTDTMHYGEWVNMEILRCMSAGECELTSENFREYGRQIAEFYENYEFSF